MARRGRCARRTRVRVLVGAVVLALAPGACAAAEPAPLPPLDLVAPPAVVAPGEVAAHLDEVVVLDTVIGAARFAGGRVVLEPADAAGVKLRVVLVPPLLGERGGPLAERFAGQHVRVLGRVREFGGVYEIFTTDPDAITIVDVTAAASAPLPSVPEPASRALPASAPPPASAVTSAPPAGASPPAAASPPAHAAAPGAVAPPPPPSHAGDASATPCGRAQRDWATAAAAAREPLAQLERCLAAGVPACADELAAARAALAEVAASAERIRWYCGRSS